MSGLAPPPFHPLCRATWLDLGRALLALGLTGAAAVTGEISPTKTYLDQEILLAKVDAGKISAWRIRASATTLRPGHGRSAPGS